MGSLRNRHEIGRLLRKHGMKATPQRLAIAAIMLPEPMHITAQKLYDQLQDEFPSISQNTVYLTLASFEEAGLLRRFYANGSMIFDSNVSAHDHACCYRCGDICDIETLPHSRQMPLALAKWRISSESRVLSGLCPACVTTQ